MKQTLTPEERMKAYVYALEQIEHINNFCTCGRLRVWLAGKGLYLASPKEFFPEFIQKKPRGASFSGSWWPIGSPLRILALEYCILEVSMRIEYEKQLKGKI